MAHRNFARGSSPPANSWEWDGAGSAPPWAPGAIPEPPGSKGAKIAAPQQVMRPSAVLLESVSVTIESRPKRWKWLLALGLGAAGGYYVGRGHGHRSP
jgi:hypothetical protein